VSGTVYRSTSHPRSHCQSSTVALRHISSSAASCDYVVVPEKWLQWLVIFGHVSRFWYFTYLL